MAVRIECLQYVMPVRRLDQRANRANERALAAGDAIGGAEWGFEDGDRTAVAAAVGEADDVLVLDSRPADIRAEPAFDAFLRVAPDGRRGVIARQVFRAMLDVRDGSGPAVLLAVFTDQPLQRAVPVHLAMHAVVGMPGEDPFRIGLAEHKQRHGVRFDHIAILRQRAARGLRVGMAFDLHEAHPADGVRRKPRMIAERRYVYTRGPRRIEKRPAGLDFDPPAIHRERDHAAKPPVAAIVTGSIHRPGADCRVHDRWQSGPAALMRLCNARHMMVACRKPAALGLTSVKYGMLVWCPPGTPTARLLTGTVSTSKQPHNNQLIERLQYEGDAFFRFGAQDRTFAKAGRSRLRTAASRNWHVFPPALPAGSLRKTLHERHLQIEGLSKACIVGAIRRLSQRIGDLVVFCTQPWMAALSAERTVRSTKSTAASLRKPDVDLAQPNPRPLALRAAIEPDIRSLSIGLCA
jgi:hypothetical protein